MSGAFLGNWGYLGWVAAKAALLFAFVIVALRLSPRRTLSQLSVVDFVTAVAVGSIVGRVPNASDTSFAAGAATLVVVLGLNRIVSTSRVSMPLGRVLDHRPAVLVRRGKVDSQTLRRERLTPDDLASLLRVKGVTDVARTDSVIFEPGGAISIVPDDKLVSSLTERGSQENAANDRFL